jgi:hypothetical protein
MAKTKPDLDNLTALISLRVSPADVILLNQVTAQHAYAKRGEIAREALRRGLAALQAEKAHR